MATTGYPSDLSAAQLALIEPHLPPPKPGGRPRRIDALVHRLGFGGIEIAPSPTEVSLMPHKFNAARRYRIPKAKYAVKNWPQYDASLC